MSGLDWQIFENGENGYEARLFLPYTWLDIEPLEVFGISLGQLPDGASWDGWGFEGVFIDPASTVNYVRVSALNRLYRAESNEAMVTLSGNAGAGRRACAGGRNDDNVGHGRRMEHELFRGRHIAGDHGDVQQTGLRFTVRNDRSGIL